MGGGGGGMDRRAEAFRRVGNEGREVGRRGRRREGVKEGVNVAFMPAVCAK